MTRGRRPTTGLQERAWLQRHRELLARDAKRLPPMPDPKQQPREFLAWAEQHGQRELSAEQRKLYDELRELPRLRFQRAQDREVWGWISYLLRCQSMGMGTALVDAGLARAPFDLRTCKLGTNPTRYGVRKPSKLLLCLTRTVVRGYPLRVPNTEAQIRRGWRGAQPETELDRAISLYDALRKWQADRRDD